MTKHFLETVSDPGKPHLYHVAARLCILSPSFTFASEFPLFPFDFASAQPANEIAMAPKRKSQNSAAAIIPPIDFNSQLPFAGNHMSVVSESDLLHLVSVGVLPSKELCSWRICRGVTVPTEDTHESVVYIPFLICGLALPISPFFRCLLDFYHLNLTHLNPNSILQSSIFVHLCEAYLGILPHFGLLPWDGWGQHQLVGGASLEMRRGRKTEYLDIPLKDSIKGWHLEWFIVQNHGKSLPPRPGRQPDVRAPSWIESPIDLEIVEVKVILAEICLLKERGLTAEAVVADFVFKNIQPLKDRAYPAYLYSGVTDSTRVTNKRIPAMDLVSQLEMILRGKVSNIGAPVAYFAWNMPPSKSFFDFVSNPPASDSGLGLRVRPSLEEVEVLVASLGDLPNDERQVHFEMPMSPGDAEISAMLDMLARDSSDSVPAETMVVAIIPEPEKIMDTRRPEGTRSKRLRQVSHPAAPAEGKKKKKRRLRRVSCLNRDAGPSVPAAEEVPVELFTGAEPDGCVPADADPNGCGPDDAELNGCGPTNADTNGCDPARADPNGCDPVPYIVRVVDEDEEEEEEVPLVRKNSRC
jgi:hypothetical protein